MLDPADRQANVCCALLSRVIRVVHCPENNADEHLKCLPMMPLFGMTTQSHIDLQLHVLVSVV